MPRLISTYDKDFYHPDVLAKLNETVNVKFGPYYKERFLIDVPDVDGILLDGNIRLNDEVLQAASKLKVVSMFGVGYDIVDVEACTRHNVYVTITPVLSGAVADLTMALMLCLSRNILSIDKFSRGEWARTNQWPFIPLGRDLCDKTLGIIGLGRIGFEVTKRAHAFGMNILYTDVTRNEKAEKSFHARFVSLNRLLKESDYVSIHTFLDEKTRGMIGEDELNLMKKDAYLINTSRGAIVDQSTLTRFLQEKKIAGAGLDVFSVEPIPEDDTLLQLDNVVLTPHLGSVTVETFKRIGMTAIENILCILRGDPPKNLVPEQKGKIFHKNENIR